MEPLPGLNQAKQPGVYVLCGEQRRASRPLVGVQRFLTRTGACWSVPTQTAAT